MWQVLVDVVLTMLLILMLFPCTPGIRSATIEYLRESCTPELQQLLQKCYSKNELQMDQDMSPWEEIFDKAATEGTSLR